MTEVGKEELIKWFSELNNKDVSIAGGKGASLSEMYNNKFPVPPGFVVTAQAYKHFIEKAGIDKEIKSVLDSVDIENTSELNEASKKIRQIIESSEFPKDLENDILEAYDVLDINKDNLNNASGGALDILRNSHEPPFVAVRSSATTEDLADASFAGQQDSYLSVKGNEDLLKKVRMCFSSLFTARAIYYRKKKGFKNDSAYLAVVVQKMIDSQKSGVMFSKNPLKDDNNIVVEAVWGLGEGIVGGKILPDHYILNRDLEIIENKVADKKIAIVRTSSGKIAPVSLTEERSKQQVLTGHEIKKLGQFALRLEEHYGKPQDIEFAIENNEVYIVQSRPITTKFVKSSGEVTGHVLFSGLPASPGVSSGVVRIIYNLEDLDNVKKGDVLVTKMTNPDMVVAMQKASGIITDEGGATSHAAIVSREMGIPAVVGTMEATQKLKDGQIVTVDGNTGRILEGKGEEKKMEIKRIVPTKTKIKVIVDLPDYADRAAVSGATSVGLVRLEGIIASSGKHPIWYLKNDKVREYIDSLYSGLKKISFHFKEVWVRSSDIRSDEYRNLEGAPEKLEGNPMLGDHGIRFSLRNMDLLEAEFKALKELADEFSDKKFGIMMPQIISVSELRESKKLAKEVGFPSNVKIGVMVETPAAVQIFNDLCEEGIDFISFGTNDLTQYTLAIDRNNPDVQELYDEMNPAVLNSIKYVLRRCKKYGIESSICGQAGSKPEMAKILVEEGISSISVNADAAYNVSIAVAEVEKSFAQEKTGASEIDTATQSQQFEVSSVQEKEKERITGASGGEISEEDLILQSLEESRKDEYLPGYSENGKRDVPDLNESIPVSTEDFNIEKGEEVFDLNKQEETIFEYEVKKEAEKSNARQSNIEKVFGKKDEHEIEGQEKDEFLDIF